MEPERERRWSGLHAAVACGLLLVAYPLSLGPVVGLFNFLANSSPLPPWLDHPLIQMVKIVYEPVILVSEWSGCEHLLEQYVQYWTPEAFAMAPVVAPAQTSGDAAATVPEAFAMAPVVAPGPPVTPGPAPAPAGSPASVTPGETEGDSAASRESASPAAPLQ